MATLIVVCDFDGRTLAKEEVRAQPRQSDSAAERDLHAKFKAQFPGMRIFYERSAPLEPQQLRRERKDNWR